MGWNSAYTIFDATVVGAYDLGKLDKDLLKVLMEPYRGTDIDSGGSEGLTSKDGLDVRDIVLKVWGAEVPPEPELPEDEADWTDEHRKADNAYWEARSKAFRKITDEFGWW
jgi:hypothetical protein